MEALKQASLLSTQKAHNTSHYPKGQMFKRSFVSWVGENVKNSLHYIMIRRIKNTRSVMGGRNKSSFQGYIEKYFLLFIYELNLIFFVDHTILLSNLIDYESGQF